MIINAIWQLLATLIIASMEQQNSHVLYSYDTGIDRIQGIARREP